MYSTFFYIRRHNIAFVNPLRVLVNEAIDSMNAFFYRIRSNALSEIRGVGLGEFFSQLQLPLKPRYAGSRSTGTLQAFNATHNKGADKSRCANNLILDHAARFSLHLSNVITMKRPVLPVCFCLFLVIFVI